MPFQSEKQRRYLWANEPEIARDWADTYGSRIQNNTGGISRLGFANGPNYQVAEEDEDENYLEKFMRFMQGNAGNLSQGDVRANKNFLGNMQFSPNNPYQMTSGLFKGMNAPGSSAMGSKTSQEMAQKWVDKYGGVDHKSPAMKEKKANIRMEAGLSPIEHAPHHSYSMGGRIGYAQGNPHQDQDPGLGMSPGAAQARGLGAIHHGSTTSGNLHAGNVGGGNVGGNAGVNIGGPEVKKKPNILGGLRNIIPFLGKKGNFLGGAFTIFDLMKQPPKTEDLILSADETTDDETDAEKLAKKIRNMEDFIANEKKKKAADIWKEFE